MKFSQRVLYFGVGLFFGILFVNYIWGNKGIEICYFPNCRVLKDIRAKKMTSEQQKQFETNTFAVDTTIINHLLNNGNVDFSKSNLKIDSCKLYKIDGILAEKNYTIMVKNCDSTMVIDKITLN